MLLNIHYKWIGARIIWLWSLFLRRRARSSDQEKSAILMHAMQIDLCIRTYIPCVAYPETRNWYEWIGNEDGKARCNSRKRRQKGKEWGHVEGRKLWGEKGRCWKDRSALKRQNGWENGGNLQKNTSTWREKTKFDREERRQNFSFGSTSRVERRIF